MIWGHAHPILNYPPSVQRVYSFWFLTKILEEEQFTLIKSTGPIDFKWLLVIYDVYSQTMLEVFHLGCSELGQKV
jgi:hypothetical protein